MTETVRGELRRALNLTRAYLLRPERYEPGSPEEERLLDRLEELFSDMTDEEFELVEAEVERLRPLVDAQEQARRSRRKRPGCRS